jgi:D-glycero-alpha-D-manno-heptose-7-phosphate kinase
MIISRTPFRISFFGGGTDYPGWYRQHGGAVLATTIDKYCYINVRYLPPFFEHRFRIVYSRIENAESVEQIAHPAVREIIRHLDLRQGLEIHHDADLPARSGMGSSSAFTVGLLHALAALKGEVRSKQQLALESIHVEQVLLRENVGSQDQVMAAYGGLNHVVFSPQGEVTVHPVTLSRARMEELNAHLMLCYTGIKRTASEVAASFVNDLNARRRQLRIMKDLVDESLAVLTSGQDLRLFGELLREAWLAKRSLSPVISNSEVDAIFERALAAGAMGGKLLGAGGGGFVLFVVPPDRRRQLQAALPELISAPVRIESSGSQIIFYDPEAEYQTEDAAREGQTVRAFRELAARTA